MKIHELRCWPDSFQAVWDGIKTFEVRVDDRNYRDGDQLLLSEYDPHTERYSGRKVLVDVPYLLPGGQCCTVLSVSAVVMSIRVVSREQPQVVRELLSTLLGTTGHTPAFTRHNENGTSLYRYHPDGSLVYYDGSLVCDRYVEVSDSVESDCVLVTYRNGRQVSSTIHSTEEDLARRVKACLGLLNDERAGG
jgi:hypothetical protein